MSLLKEVKKIYAQNLKINKPYFEQEQWKSLAKFFGMSRTDFLYSMLDFAKSFSVSPISKYTVGCLGIGKSQRLFLGTNIEFPGKPLNESIHAEQCLVSMAYANLENDLEEIYLTAFPCGHCRQFFQEIANFHKVKIYIESHKEKYFRLSELLPNAFGPKDLNISKSLFSTNENEFKFQLARNSKKIKNEIKEKLLKSISRSFAPYSKNPVSVVFEFEKNKLILGSSIESCAFNPSLGAFHMAYSQVIINKLSLKKLNAVYYCELKNTVTSSQQSTLELLKLTAPQTDFYNFYAHVQHT